jgi:dihydropteroate synthase
MSSPTHLSASTRLYLRPIGLMQGEAAASLAARGEALPLAGGRLAFTACEIILRDRGAITRDAVPVVELRRWVAGLPGNQQARPAQLLDRLSSSRPERYARPRLLGIVNVTPDSFSDGGQHLDPAAALARIGRLIEAGADIIDIGGESTRPGATPLPVADELARLAPVLERLPALRAAHPAVRFSIDTRRAAVMGAALAAGIDILNDVSALTHDPDSLAVAAAGDADIVVMHMPGEPATMNEAPAYDDVVLDVFDFLEARLAACVAAGLDRRRLIVDPGLGFGKRGRHNRALMRSLALLHGLGCPILLGASRKGFGAATTSVAPRDRLAQSLAAALHGLDQGAQLLRVHDVAETRQAMEVWLSLNDAGDAA